MTLHLTWLNCLWLVLPLLAWNLFLGPRITDPRITSDAASPKWQLAVETISRILIFALPVLFPLQVKGPWDRSALMLYVLGVLIYFATWFPLIWAPAFLWRDRPAGLLAPRWTPILPLLAIALLGRSWPYGSLAGLFVLFHTWHGIQNLKI